MVPGFPKGECGNWGYKHCDMTNNIYSEHHACFVKKAKE